MLMWFFLIYSWNDTSSKVVILEFFVRLGFILRLNIQTTSLNYHGGDCDFKRHIIEVTIRESNMATKQKTKAPLYHYDAIVIGTGPGGEGVAMQLGDLELREIGDRHWDGAARACVLEPQLSQIAECEERGWQRRTQQVRALAPVIRNWSPSIKIQHTQGTERTDRIGHTVPSQAVVAQAKLLHSPSRVARHTEPLTGRHALVKPTTSVVPRFDAERSSELDKRGRFWCCENHLVFRTERSTERSGDLRAWRERERML